ncbi:MAG TPA: hypothetical protein PK817_09770 [Dokdonella sp.]|nr:hypothetical protein [Dokdonella sp.]
MARPSSIFPCTLLLAGLIAAAGGASAAIFTVGSGAGCSHGTIQSAINAANASPGADTVRLTRSLTYQPEAVTINAAENLNLVGGFGTCTQAATDNSKTVVSGAGGAADPVLRITAGTGIVVKLRHLTITQGDEDGNGGGGGIAFQGDGVLEIIESNITNNSAAFGGGIYALGTGSNAELIISESTVISGNTARYSGGGVSIGGPIEMTMTAPNSIIAFNDALGQAAGTGYGGGLQVSGQARAYIGTSGVGGLGAIYGNTAIDGGGIAVISGAANGADAVAYLFTTNPSQPIGVIGNYASDTGGAVYLQSYQATGTASAIGRLCASDFRLDGNAARDGSALYLNSDSALGLYEGSEVYLNDPACTQPQAVRCSSTISCNTISGNDAVETGGEFSNGATLRILAGATLNAKRVEMRNNRGGDGMRATGEFATVSMKDCLLAGNQFSRQLMRTEGEYSLAYILGCTIAGNLINSTDLFHIEHRLALNETIIDQPGNLTLAFSGIPEGLNVASVLASDISTLPLDPTIITGDPSFIDATNGDYHLRQYSLAVDFAPPVTGDDRDLDNLPRDQDIVGVPDALGVRDLGAYERQVGAGDCGAADTIFCNGFDP